MVRTGDATKDRILQLDRMLGLLKRTPTMHQMALDLLKKRGMALEDVQVKWNAYKALPKAISMPLNIPLDVCRHKVLANFKENGS